jgi:hypothetical protein
MTLNKEDEKEYTVTAIIIMHLPLTTSKENGNEDDSTGQTNGLAKKSSDLTIK